MDREIYRLLHKAVLKAPSGLSTEQIADRLEKNANSLLYEVNPTYKSRKFGVEHLPELVNATQDYAPLHFLNRQCGAVCLRLPEVREEGHPVHEQCMESVAKFGELMGSCSAILADGRITHDEAALLADSGYEAIRSILALLQKTNMEARHETGSSGTLSSGIRRAGR